MIDPGSSSIYTQMFRTFGLTENPFHFSPDPRFLYTGAAYETAGAELMFGVESRRGLMVLTGEAGTGKTTLLRQFLRWLESRRVSTSYVFHTHLDPAGLFEFILRDFGVPVESSKKTDLLASMHRWLHARQVEGDAPVVVIDEAQALSLRTLSELSLLLNLENERGKLVQIVLAGQPELEEKLRRPELRQLRQRIMVRCRLPLLTLEETNHYIAARLRGAGGDGARLFPDKTVETVYSYARGIPRVTNLLCEHALIGAYADRQDTVTPSHVRRVAAEFDLVGEAFQADMPHGSHAATALNSRPAAQAPESIIDALAETQARWLPPQQAEAPAAPTVSANDSAGAEVREPETQATLEPHPVPEPVAVRKPVTAVMTASAPASATTLAYRESPAHPILLSAAASTASDPAIRPVPRVPFVAQGQPGNDRIERPAEKFVERTRAAAAPIAYPLEPRHPERSYSWRKHHNESAIRRYLRDVSESFLRDIRQLFRSSSPTPRPAAAGPRPAATTAQGSGARNSAHNVGQSVQNVSQSVGQGVDSVRGWLKKPIGSSGNGRPSKPAARAAGSARRPA